MNETATSLAVQWLGLGTLTAVDPGLIPGQGTKILQAVHCSQKKKKGDIRRYSAPFKNSTTETTDSIPYVGL